MTDMVDSNEQESVEQHDEDQAFAAGFNETRGEEPPHVEAAESTSEPVQETVVESPVEEQPQRNQWGFTDDEMKDILTKAARVTDLERRMEEDRQKIHGKLGEAFGTLKQLQQSRQSAGVQLTEDDLDEELREQFPEMAKMQLATLNRVLSKALGGVKPGDTNPQTAASQPAPAIDPEVIDQRLAETEDKLSKQYEAKLLSMAHPDWKEQVATDDFKAWLAMQPENVRQQLDNSWDASFLSRGIAAFKQWRASVQSARTKKTNRLEAAVTPRGIAAVGQTTPDEEAAMLAGWRSVRG